MKDEEPRRRCYTLRANASVPERVVDGVVYPAKDLGPIEGFIHGDFGEPCFHCGGIAEALCDFPIGEEGRTCDRPLCLQCAPEVGLDKNYCHEHQGHGANLVLFRPNPSFADQAAQREINLQLVESKRAPRLPKAPPVGERWRAVNADGSPKSGWTDELTAERAAGKFRVKGIDVRVQSWDEFAFAWRKLYPLKPRKPRKKP